MPDPVGLREGPATAHARAVRCFLDEALAAFEAAAARVGRRERTVAMAGRAAHVAFAGDAMEAHVGRALLRSSVPAPARDLRVYVFDSRSTRTSMPAPPWAPDDVRERGEVPRFSTPHIRCAFNAGSKILTVWDRREGRALVWTPDARSVPYYETASPLRTLWAWWLGGRGLHVIHAGAVGAAGAGVLLTGRGGAGKTTTALACVAAGMAYGGDNNLVLEASPTPRGHAMFTSATVRPDTLDLIPALRSRLQNPERLGEEKGLLFVDDEPGVRLLRSFDVRCVLLPEVVPVERSEMARARPGACLAALAPSSILSVPFARAEAFTTMARFVRGVPAVHLRLGRDLSTVVPLVRRVLEGDLP